MLAKPVAFEQDKNAIFLRNQEMHLHYTKLEAINNRKNCYLPVISTKFKTRKMNCSTSAPHMNFKSKEEQYFINRDNMYIYKRLDKIVNRNNQLTDDSKIIDGYLNIKKHTRERVRALKKQLLNKENVIIKDRLRNTKPVIDNVKVNEEFQTSKRICNQLRKVTPSNNVSTIYLSKNESQQIREYEKEKLENALRKRNVVSGVNTQKSGEITGMRKILNPIKIDRKVLAKVRYTGYDF